MSASTARCSRSPARDVGPSDRILVDGKPLPAAEPVRLWRYHKPRGLVTTHRDPQGRPTVFEKLPPEMPRVVSIGRLDFNTEGLLLLTNDGALARHLELPSTGWLRRYRVRAHGRVAQDSLDKLKDGIEIEGVRYGPIEATLDKEQGANVWLSIGLREGKNREVRKILSTLGARREPADPHLVRAVPAARAGSRAPSRSCAGACWPSSSGPRLARELGLAEEAEAVRRGRPPAPSSIGQDEDVRIIAGSWRGRAFDHSGTTIAFGPTSDRVQGRHLQHPDARRRRIRARRRACASTCSPALARWDSRPCRAARRTAFSWRRTAPRARLLSRNIALLDFDASCEILAVDAARLGPAGRRPPCNLAFLDPPYGKGLGERALAALAEGRWLAPDAIIVAEESAGATIVWPAGYEVLDVRRWGDTQAAFARYKS